MVRLSPVPERPRSAARVASAYDVVVVGAGVGGLVAAGLLARAGLHVLLAERHSVPGGCCTSFRRKRFVFDCAVHTLAGLGPGGTLRGVLEELGVSDRVCISRRALSDYVVAPEFAFGVGASPEETCAALQRVFPQEASGLERFFAMLMSSDFPTTFARYGRAPFRRVLDEHFSEPLLQATIEMLLGYNALPADKILAVAAIKLLQWLVLDAGYYPLGGQGMQGFANALALRFAELGGDLLLHRPVERIEVCDGMARAVWIAGERIETRYVVSNADAKATFLELIEPGEVPALFRSRIATMTGSISAFCVFAGVRVPLRSLAPAQANLVYFDPRRQASDRLLRIGSAPEETFLYVGATSLHDPGTAPPGYGTLALITGAPYATPEFWETHRREWQERLLAAGERLLPGLRGHCVHVESATPRTIERFTGNSRGSIYGWACEPSQDGFNRLGNRTPIGNLYLAGHWTRPGAGVPLVARSGQMVAGLILRREAARGRRANAGGGAASWRARPGNPSGAALASPSRGARGAAGCPPPARGCAG